MAKLLKVDTGGVDGVCAVNGAVTDLMQQETVRRRSQCEDKDRGREEGEM